ncbi:transporter [Adhaeribacter aerolatus]|uniref:Transporter n=1 Tax=Adhaeribacter aerolatus TaxID=670289 RepID=A0A512AZT3_9BACT|nr:TolC family protein [Adhaeribacter aerolatus]GEO05225.1 transporter [Adhaeribacter aerolatus]
MKIKIILVLACLWGGSFPISAQSSLEEVLTAVGKNNRALAANKHYLEAKKQSFRTGLNPANPVVNYDYLKGSPAEAGNQTDFEVMQALDFPTTYFRKRDLATEQSRQAEAEWQVNRQQILLEAKLTYLELIYQNKRALELARRTRHLERLAADFQKRIQQGDIGILEVNKAKLQLIQVQNEQRVQAADRALQNQKLAELNGGTPLPVQDTTYQTIPALPRFETLDSLIEANDPIVKTFEQQKVVSEKQVAVTRALTLPKLETGYHYQAILGQRYQGLHLGVSIPLWENKNTVQAQLAEVKWREAQLQEHRLEHQSVNRQWYTQYESLGETLKAYRAIFTSANNLALLQKALRLGQISTIVYFQELGYFYSSYDTFQRAEKEYQQAIARLYKFQL